MTVSDPRWTPEDRAWALALESYEASLCPKCGQPMSVCMAPENEGRFIAEPPIRCHSTTVLANFQKDYEDDPALLFEPARLRSPAPTR